MKQLLFTILALTFATFSFSQDCVADFNYSIDTNEMTIDFQDVSWSSDSSQNQSTPSSWSWSIDGSVVDTTSSFTYTYSSLPVIACLSVEFDSGCSSDVCDTIDVEEEDPCENFSVYVGNYEVEQDACNGELTATVNNGTEPFNYNWSNQEETQTIADLCEGEYSVTVQDANGCEYFNYGYVYVAVDSSQVNDSLYNSVDTCLNFEPSDAYISNVIIIDNTTIEVEWVFVGQQGDNQQQQTITETYTFSGDYGSYAVTIEINCAKSSQTWSDVIVIDENTPTGITKINNLNNLKLYPNPVKDVLNIEFNSTETNTINIQIVSYTGQVISNININASMGNNTISIATNNLDSGIYFVRLNGKTIKFVK